MLSRSQPKQRTLNTCTLDFSPHVFYRTDCFYVSTYFFQDFLFSGQRFS
jgi:hypothetical protein